jgi:hypothetical protein
MTAWPAKQMAAHGGVGIPAVVLLLPAMEAALPVIASLLPGQTAVALGATLTWQGHVTVEAALLTALGRCGPRQPGRIRSTAALEGPDAGTAPGRGGPAPGHRAGPRAHRTPGRRRDVRRPLHRRPAHPDADPVRGDRMPLRRYLLWSVASSAVWAPAFVLIGHVFAPAGPG